MISDGDAPAPQKVRLGDLRSRYGRTQGEIAAAIGTTQSAVSRLERQQDLLVSSLSEYISATGGTLHLVARFGAEDVELSIPAAREEANQLSGRSLRVIWQNPDSRQLIHVGSLEGTASGYRFSYTDDARSSVDFAPFAAFPDLDKTYRSSDLFAFFAGRVPVTPRAGHDALRTALGLTRAQATPFELLARTGGSSPHDTLQIVPSPTIGDDHWNIVFPASGVRHAQHDDDRVEDHVASLAPGTPLELLDEPTNPQNPRAILIRHQQLTLGWIPDHMIDEVREIRKSAREIKVGVERANGADAPWHLRLLCRLEAALGKR